MNTVQSVKEKTKHIKRGKSSQTLVSAENVYRADRKRIGSRSSTRAESTSKNEYGSVRHKREKAARTDTNFNRNRTLTPTSRHMNNRQTAKEPK